MYTTSYQVHRATARRQTSITLYNIYIDDIDDRTVKTTFVVDYSTQILAGINVVHKCACVILLKQ